MLRISELRLPLDHPPEALAAAIAKRLEIPAAAKPGASLIAKRKIFSGR
ncbi:MAG: hypothetical protein HY777_01690 [Betaproteobacteria bacterium]|nr:hypothetical protein [Betaproteobacteria bacterium]